MTTVGFGDVTPDTWVARCFTVVAMFLGILAISLPVAVLGNQFQELEHMPQETVSMWWGRYS